MELYAIDPTVRFAGRAARPSGRCARCSPIASTATCARLAHHVAEPGAVRPAEIEYASLDELCAAEEYWRDRHPALADASPAARQEIATVLLDYMRRELGDPGRLPGPGLPGEPEAAEQPAADRALGDRRGRRLMAHAIVLFPRSRAARRLPRQRLRLCPRRLRPVPAPLEHASARRRASSRSDDTETIIRAPARGAPRGRAGRGRGSPATGRRARLPAPRLRAASGSRRRQPRLPRPDPHAAPVRDGGHTNPFFVDFYQGVAADCRASRRASTPPRCSREDRTNARSASGKASCRSSSARRRWSWASTSPS